MNPISMVMPPLESYEERLLLYTPTTDKIGIMEFLEKRKKNSKKARVRKYCVLFDTFLLLGDMRFKLTKPGGKEKYDVLLSNAEYDVCGCVAYEKDGKCSHIQALRLLAAAGVLYGTSKPPTATGAGRVNDGLFKGPFLALCGHAGAQR